MFISLLLGLLLVPATISHEPTQPLPISQPRASIAPGNRTPLGQTEARLHLELAYRAVLGQAPPPRTVALMLAQWALETGRGEKMWGFNFAGLKATRGGANLATREACGIRLCELTQRFRTYHRATDGARDYVETLRSDFPLAFEALKTGNAADFATALAKEGYFTGSKVAYRRAMLLLSHEFASSRSPPLARP